MGGISKRRACAWLSVVTYTSYTWELRGSTRLSGDSQRYDTPGDVCLRSGTSFLWRQIGEPHYTLCSSLIAWPESDLRYRAIVRVRRSRTRAPGLPATSS